MAAWSQTLTPEDARSVRDEHEWIRKQKRRVCIVCELPWDQCGCPDYETFDSRPLEGDDDPVYGV